MTKSITSLQWNIGAGKIRPEDADALTATSYVIDGLSSVVELIQRENPDIITLQEVHSDGSLNQVEVIAMSLGYKYYVSDFYSDSHIEPGQRLGQGIISRFPLANHTSQTFLNPNFEVTWKNGATATTHDKGVTCCSLNVDRVVVTIMTLHLIPFDPFRINPRSKSAEPIFADVESKLLAPRGALIIQGDFNLGHTNPPVAELMPGLATSRIEELILQKPTIPNGEWPDRIVSRGLKPIKTEVLDNVLTDHYPVVTTFELLK